MSQFSESSGCDNDAVAADWVVDASVGIKLFIDGPLSNNAHQLFQRLVERPSPVYYVPDLFYIECTNILWKYVRFQGMAPDVATGFIRSLDQLILERVPTPALMEDALTLSIEHEISAYDACYVALAQRLNISLITADNKLASKLNHLDKTIYSLEDIT